MCIGSRPLAVGGRGLGTRGVRERRVARERSLTLNLGARFDRYRLYLPAQEHPVGQFNPTPQTFAAVDNIVDWNVVSPRFGVILDPAGDGRTVVKVSYSRYWLNPGVATAFNANPNAPIWWRSYTWADANGSGLWEPGEEGRALQTRGGRTLEQLDPELQLPFVREAATAVEHELGTVMSLRAGLTWREEQQQYLRQDASRPFSAYSVPVRIADPGPDGAVGTADDGADIDGRELQAVSASPSTSCATCRMPTPGIGPSTWWARDARAGAGRWSRALPTRGAAIRPTTTSDRTCGRTPIR